MENNYNKFSESHDVYISKTNLLDFMHHNIDIEVDGNDYVNLSILDNYINYHGIDTIVCPHCGKVIQHF